MSELEYLTLEDCLGIANYLGIGPIRDVGLLDSALSRPRSNAFGQDAYQSIELKASALLHSLIKNHALVDGTKRLAWLCTAVFLRLNGDEPLLNPDRAFDVVVDIASGALELEEICRRLNVRPRDR